MPSILKNNAYHILGLDILSSEKIILKRSKEIINHIKVDEIPSYDLDMGLSNNFRTEDAVKDALQRLQSPKKRIKEFFFWFQIADGVDERAMGLFKTKDYLNAIRVWEMASVGQTTKAFFYKKNLAILYCLILSTEDNGDYLRSSLIAWKEIIESEKFWISFSKIYKLHDEQTASKDIITDLRKHVIEYLSDIYTDLHHIHKNSDYINEFQNTFSVKGEKIEKSILAPAYKSINEAVEGLESMRVSEDNKFDEEEAKKIKNFVARVQQELNKLIDLGLYEDSQTKIMRDRSANALRSIVLDLHNNLNELNKSEGLLEVAIKLAGTESLKNKLRSELEQIQKNIRDEIDNSLEIELPGGGSVFCNSSYLEYQNKRIHYKDVTDISYHAQSQSINFVPVSQSYSYMVASPDEKISFSFGTTLHIGEGARKDVWAKLIGLSGGLIEPHIVRGMIDRIFDRDEPVMIGGIEFSKQGYSRIKSKLFGKGEKETVYWTDTIYTPEFKQGFVYLWKENNGKGSQFTSVAMSVPNAVVIPALIQACLNRK